MNFHMSFYIPPSRLTFEAATQLQREVGTYQSTIEFEGFSGMMTVCTNETMSREVLSIFKESDALLMDLRGEGRRDFQEYFGSKVKLDFDKAQIYCMMCEEGRI